MSAVTHNFPDIFTGDTFKAYTITLTRNGTPLDLTGHDLRIWFRRGSTTGPVGKELSIGSGITIIDGPAGVIRIDPFQVEMIAGKYYHDFHFDLDTGDETLVKGTMKVIEDVTD